jgi:hypothetical protein
MNALSAQAQASATSEEYLAAAAPSGLQHMHCFKRISPVQHPALDQHISTCEQVTSEAGDGMYSNKVDSPWTLARGPTQVE